MTTKHQGVVERDGNVVHRTSVKTSSMAAECAAIRFLRKMDGGQSLAWLTKYEGWSIRAEPVERPPRSA